MSEGGESRQIVNLQEIIDSTTKELHEIESSKSNQSTKTKKFKRLADKVKNKLHDDGRKTKAIKVTTYKRYVSKVRNAIKETGLTHHSLHGKTARAGTLARVIKDYPEYKDLLEGLKTEHAETIGALKNTILKNIQADKTNKRRGAAYKAVKAMNTDHEVLRHLFMDEVDMADWSTHKTDSLADKKQNTVDLNYNDILKTIRDGLSTSSYTRQAFALALASGRRSIEILFNAAFKLTGENTVSFEGQAKKQTGIETEAYEIYTLIPADEFIKAFEAFRNLPAIEKMHSDFSDMNREERNTEINRRTAKTMNEAAKRAMDDNARVFKDSRAIYTRICLDTFFDSDSRWDDADEDVFTKHLLGHGDFTAQAAYKQFKIDYEAPESQTDIKPTADTDDQTATGEKQGGGAPEVKNKELKKAEKILKKFIKENPSRSQLMDYFHLVVIWVDANPNRKITFSALYKKDKGGIGGNRDTVKDFLSITADSIQAYNDSKG